MSHEIIEIESGKRIGLIGDLHCDINSLMRIERNNPNIDQWILLGDVLDMKKPAHLNDPIARFAGNHPKFKVIRGNHENALLKSHETGLSPTERAMVTDWPLFLSVFFDEYSFSAAHQKEHIENPDGFEFLAYAHTHSFEMEESKGVWHLNPGLSVSGRYWIEIETSSLQVSRRDVA